MQPKTTLLLAVILSAITAFAVVKLSSAPASIPPHKETAYERVMRTGTLRCGYGVYPPYFTKDPASGNFGGIWHDLSEAIGENLGLKVEWTEEVGLGDIGAALDAKKIDIYCGGLWTAGKRVRAVDFLNPIHYEAMFVYVRTDDHRFDANISLINDPAVKISKIDGEGGGLVATEEFPNATPVSLPQLSGYADMFNQVVTKKADLLLAAPTGASAFLKNNPNTLRPILNQPVRIFPMALAVRYGENELRDLINQAQDGLFNSQKVEKIILKYEASKGDFWRVIKPYEAPQ